MSAIRSLDDLKRFREKVVEKKAQDARRLKAQVIVSLGSCGIAAGALQTMQAILDQARDEHLHDVQVSLTGCNGQCEQEPIVQVIANGQEKVTYGKVTPQVAGRILHEHIMSGKVVQEYVI